MSSLILRVKGQLLFLLGVDGLPDIVDLHGERRLNGISLSPYEPHRLPALLYIFHYLGHIVLTVTLLLPRDPSDDF